MMLLDVFLEGLFEMDLRRVNSEEVGHWKKRAYLLQSAQRKNEKLGLIPAFEGDRKALQGACGVGQLSSTRRPPFAAAAPPAPHQAAAQFC
jgi:hypothetical protein